MTPQSLTPLQALAIARTHAQAAVAVELYTLPFYLSALASLTNTTAAQNASPVVLSVCMEEMFHLEIAANICLALGVQPNFTAPQYGPTITPTFPDGTPILDPEKDPATNDSGAIYAVIGNLVDTLPIMLDIEVPTEFEPPDLQPPYDSIGQFYAALQLAANAAESALPPPPWPTTNQVSGYFNLPEIITSLDDLNAAIGVITEQGEGKAQSPAPTPPFQQSDFAVDPADQLTGEGLDPASQSQYSHFGRFIYLQTLNLGAGDVYTGTPNPTSAENQQLQTDFGALIANLNNLWLTGNGDLSAMYGLLTDATNVWVAGNIPQWTSPT